MTPGDTSNEDVCLRVGGELRKHSEGALTWAALRELDVPGQISPVIFPYPTTPRLLCDRKAALWSTPVGSLFLCLLLCLTSGRCGRRWGALSTAQGGCAPSQPTAPVIGSPPHALSSPSRAAVSIAVCVLFLSICYVPGVSVHPSSSTSEVVEQLTFISHLT